MVFFMWVEAEKMSHQSLAEVPAGPSAFVAIAVRRERERLGLTASDLAKRAGLSKSTLSLLEAGNGNPSIETLWGLAGVLGVPVSRLIEPPRQGVSVVRAGEGATVRAEQSAYAATLLATCPPAARRDIYRLVVQPGRPHESQPHRLGTVEHLLLCQGRASAGPVGSVVELAAGDFISYPADVPHVFAAHEPDTSAVLIIETI